MEHKNQNGGNTPNVKQRIEKVSANNLNTSDDIKKEDITIGADPKQTAFTDTGKEDEKKNVITERAKKQSAEEIEVLPNRSWVTNFYHNYRKAVESADVTPKQTSESGTQQAGHFNPAKETKVLTNNETNTSPNLSNVGKSQVPLPLFPFKSIMFEKPIKFSKDFLVNLKPDHAIINVFRSLSVEDKHKVMNSPLDGNSMSSISTPRVKNVVNPMFNLQDVPFKQLDKLGITQNELLRNGMLEKLLNGEKVAPAGTIQIKNSKGEAMSYKAIFQLEKKADGSTGIKLNHLPQTPAFTVSGKNMETNLIHAMKKQVGEKGSVPSLKEPVSKRIVPMLTTDNQRKTLQGNSIPQRYIPNEIKGVKLAPEQQQSLREGKEINVSGLSGKDGSLFDATFKMDPEKNHLRCTHAYPLSRKKEASLSKEQDTVAKAQVKIVHLSQGGELTGRVSHMGQPKGMRR